MGLWAHLHGVTETLWTAELTGSTWRGSSPAAEIMRKQSGKFTPLAGTQSHPFHSDSTLQPRRPFPSSSHTGSRGILRRDSQEALTLTPGFEVFRAHAQLH